ncbi:MAG: YiiG family protein, partial [Oxalobacter sp.]|nr:YiiG family protein [Oxalobacter sp.]
DAALKPVVEAGEKLLAQQKELEPYFKSKAYKEDDLAKGKAAFPEMLANYDVMIAAMDKVDDLLTAYQRAASEKRLAGFKDKGDMLRYYTEESMLYAQDILSVFEDPEQTIKSAESYTKADEILPKLEASLEAHRKVIEEEKGKGTSVGSYESVNSNLTSLLGSYRDLRQKKSGNAYNSMTKRYNDAVDSYNRAARFSR